MYSQRSRLEIVLLWLLLPAPTAWAQTLSYAVSSPSIQAASAEDAFSAYHSALRDAADGLLASPQPASGLQSSDAAFNRHRPEGSVLLQFAQHDRAGQEQNLRRAVARVASLRPTLDPILHQESVPVDVAALVLVESGGRPTALSPKGALGLWQLMPETARRYGLVVTPTMDERTDVVKSTHAAAHYLRDLYSQFGDWKLAFAAYNAGERAVQSAMEHGARDFETLSWNRGLPMETRNYVPSVLSAVHLLGGALPTQSRLLQSTHAARVIYADSALATELVTPKALQVHRAVAPPGVPSKGENK